MPGRKEYSVTDFAETGQSVMIDGLGNCEVADAEKHHIDVWDANGTIVTAEPHASWKERGRDPGPAMSVIYDLVRRDIPVSLRMHEGRLAYGVGGFYKSGEVLLVPGDGHFVAHCRYDNRTEIENMLDLAYLNLSWWESSRDRSAMWMDPDAMWAPVLLEYGLVEAKTQTKYEVKRKR